MIILHVKTPNGNQKDIDLDKVAYDIKTGSANGTISVDGSDVSVKGLDSAAYTASTAYSASNHNHDSTYLKLAALPAGVVVPYAKNAAPTGWLLCDGSAVSRTTYAALFAVIGTTYGAGNGSTTFNLPNLVNRMVVGSGSSYAIAASGGEATHKLTVAELAQHNHTFTGSAVTSGNNSVGHTHSRGTMEIYGSFTKISQAFDGTNGCDGHVFTFTQKHWSVVGKESSELGGILEFKASGNWTGSTSGQSANHTHSVTAAGTIGNNGSNTAHNNMPPYLAMRYIIKY